MVHFMAKWSHFKKLPAAFLNLTPKPDILKITLGTNIQTIMPKNKDKFYIYNLWITKSYDILKSHKEHAHTGMTP